MGGWDGMQNFVERLSSASCMYLGCSASSKRNGHLIVVVRHLACFAAVTCKSTNVPTGLELGTNLYRQIDISAVRPIPVLI